ncbi:hypothetical protein DFJ58DRAFT_726244 [Suillus subalutaceus]|uniref:uncharacterized protein n=1 Tax=Suillus subalutaceus TaxID=48586 RepID=UPI001B86C761|nr:uncharacterized protein DFJ58DRAFT_726244 [Suillus subalutaceus]KAG1859522.1 hypothetical protein DFJ58DRAFT_726244 [Suillus subalutaceus]
MLRWLSLALVLATNVVALPIPQSKEPSDAPSQCQARAWVRAPDMVPGEVIAGDVKIKLRGPCTGAESYTLGLRYKEKTSRQTGRCADSENAQNDNSGSPNYNEAEWRAYENSVQNKDLWSIHEEERIAFEIKSPLVADPLSTNFTTQFGVLVPNTNYPPGIDCRGGSISHGGADMISSESIYEYFVEIGFSNGTTSEIRAGITAFTPFYPLTENNAPSVNVSLSPAPAPGPPRSRFKKPSADRLQSNYTIELSFPEGAQVYQNSSMKFTAIVHRTGYTNRTETPVQLCAFSANDIEWHSEELQNLSRPSLPSIIGHWSLPLPQIKFVATPALLTDEGHIFSASSEPLSLSLYMGPDGVPDFSTYYQKLGHHVNLKLHIAPDPSEPWDNEFEKKQWEMQKKQWERQIAKVDMDADELDWVPWMPPTQIRRRSLSGDANVLSVIPMQKKQGPVRSTPVHYLSDNARQPVFVDSSDIADLRLMLPEERDLIAPAYAAGYQGFCQGKKSFHVDISLAVTHDTRSTLETPGSTKYYLWLLRVSARGMLWTTCSLCSDDDHQLM